MKRRETEADVEERQGGGEGEEEGREGGEGRGAGGL